MHTSSRARASARRGVTLAEILIASAMMATIALSMATLSEAARRSREHILGQGDALQHARVALQRVQNACVGAYATEEFPGMVVLSRQASGYSFPEVLVVWRPEGQPGAPAAGPLVEELVIFCTDPATPNELVEISRPGDSRPAPSVGDTAGWRALIAALLADNAARRVTLTDRLRTARVSSDSLVRRGAVRFATRVRPSVAEIAAYREGDVAWESLPWAQGIRGTGAGLAQAACSVELQIVQNDAADDDAAGADALPFFGSTAKYFQVER